MRNPSASLHCYKFSFRINIELRLRAPEVDRCVIWETAENDKLMWNVQYRARYIRWPARGSALFLQHFSEYQSVNGQFGKTRVDPSDSDSGREVN